MTDCAPAGGPRADAHPSAHHRVAAVVPVLNEVEAIGPVVERLRLHGACCVIVVDGGSTDGTARAATEAGARVIREPRRGYGRACLTGAEAALAPGHAHEVVVFLDGDGSCDPADLPALVEPLLADDRADVVLGVRPAALVEAGALPWHARLGNALVAALLAARTGRQVGDLPPMKAIRADVLRGLRLDADGYAWTVQLVARVLRRPDLRVARRPIRFRRRTGGISKVSGSWRASLRAGREMLATALRETRRRPLLALVAKAPEPGRVKTRLAAAIGDEAAVAFWRACLGDLGERLAERAAEGRVDLLVVVPSPAAVEPVARLVGPAWRPLVQAEAGLAGALRTVFHEARRVGAPSAVAISGDNPTLPNGRIDEAWAGLRGRRRAVLGPTADGGYFLVGLTTDGGGPLGSRRWAATLAAVFAHEAMGTASARNAASDALRGRGYRLALVSGWPDVDTLADLRDLESAPWPGEIAPRTAAWLTEWARPSAPSTRRL